MAIVIGPDEIRPWVELLIVLAIVAGVIAAVRPLLEAIFETFAGLR